MNKDHKLYKEDLISVISLSLPWGNLCNSTILITGATGLIGTFLVDVLMERNKLYNDNIKVLALCRDRKKAIDRFGEYHNNSNFQLVEQDVCEPIKILEKIDYIIHAASNADPVNFSIDPVGTMKANLIGTINLLEYAKSYGVKRFMFISSGEVYGENMSNYDSLNENYYGYVDCNSPRSCYPESKRAAESLCVSYSEQFGLDIVIARLCHTYGPTMTSSDSRVIAQFIRNAVSNKDIVMKSKGLQERSLCYTVDSISAMLYIFLFGKNGHAYNIANKYSNVTIRQMAETISDLFGLQVTFELPSNTEKSGYSKVNSAILNASKLEDLGWKPKITFNDGVYRTVNILKKGCGRIVT